MKKMRLLRWIGAGFGSLVALAVVACAALYIRAELILRRTYDFPVVAVAIPTDAASVAEGRRLATIRGCMGGCHGKEIEGIVMFDQPLIGRIVAPNLTAAVRRYSDAQLAAIIRHGVRPDGRSLIVMPSEMLTVLTDEDLGRIIAFLRSMPPADGPGPGIKIGPLGRIGLAVGKFKTTVQLIDETVAPPAATNELAERGRYLARTTCPQCHGTSLRGYATPDFVGPDLQIVAAYSPEAFTKLMRTGLPLGDRYLPTMGPWAKYHLSHLTDDEITALYAYLHAMPAATGG
jgi:mono/diheme cytochrome c family protein